MNATTALSLSSCLRRPSVSNSAPVLSTLTNNMSQDTIPTNPIRFRHYRGHRTQAYPHPHLRRIKAPARAVRTLTANYSTPTQFTPISTSKRGIPRQQRHHHHQMDLFTDLPYPNTVADSGTPSSLSPASSCMVTTPSFSPHRECLSEPSAGTAMNTVVSMDGRWYAGKAIGEMAGTRYEFFTSYRPEAEVPLSSWAPGVYTSNPISDMRKQDIPPGDHTDYWLDWIPAPHDIHDDPYPTSKQPIPYSEPHSSTATPATTHHVASTSSSHHSHVSSSASLSLSFPSTNAKREQSRPILHQPQPIRPIPLIPLSSLSRDPCKIGDSPRSIIFPGHQPWHPTPEKTDLLPQNSLLCQPAPDSVRFQLDTPTDTQHIPDVPDNIYPPVTSDHSLLHSSPPRDHAGPTETARILCGCGCFGGEASTFSHELLT